MIYLPSNNSTNIVTNKIVLHEHAVIQKIQMKNKCSNDFLNENSVGVEWFYVYNK